MYRRKKLCKLLKTFGTLFCFTFLLRIIEQTLLTQGIPINNYLAIGGRTFQGDFHGFPALTIRSTTTTTTTTTRKPAVPKKQIAAVRRGVAPARKQPAYGSKITYPLNIDMDELVKNVSSHGVVSVQKINPHDFKYVYNPSFQCEMESNNYPFVVIFVKSAFENFRKREAIRTTWGNITKYKGDTRLVFLLGYSDKNREKLQNEYETYKDIVCENFNDTYWNNTHKMIMGFNWAVTNCAKSKFFFFVDDDYFVNVEALLGYLKGEKDPNLFTGFALPRSQPYRNVGGKWYVSVEDYPHHHYPPYLAGGAYITSMSVAKKFSIVFPYVKHLVIDDAYLGIVAQKLNIKPKHNRKFLYTRNCGRSQDSIIACHGYSDEKKLVNDWNDFVKRRNNIATQKPK